jgi:hypothetical protein
MLTKFENFINEELGDNEILHELWKDIEKPILDRNPNSPNFYGDVVEELRLLTRGKLVRFPLIHPDKEDKMRKEWGGTRTLCTVGVVDNVKYEQIERWSPIIYVFYLQSGKKIEMDSRKNKSKQYFITLKSTENNIEDPYGEEDWGNKENPWDPKKYMYF